MRSGEVAIPSRNSFDPSYYLAWEDLAVNSCENPTFMQLTLIGLKTDPFRQEVKITIGCTGDKCCDKAGPLFKLPSGVPMTRPYFVGKVREVLSNLGLAARSYAGHSFRVGAATTIAMVGIEDSLIQTLGCWRSSALAIHQNSKGQATAYVLQISSRESTSHFQDCTVETFILITVLELT